MALHVLKNGMNLKVFQCGYITYVSINSTFSKRFSSSFENVRVRFAPSPTGFLHLGGLRTALYNYLFARANEGKFILRIEDTDQTRLVPGALEHLQKTLDWAGLTPDEGPGKGDFGPYIQSERLHLYQTCIKTLLQNGTAYPCFCTPRRLELMKREANRRNEHPRYDNRCASLTDQEVEENMQQGKPYVVRLRLSPTPNPFQDIIKGPLVHNIINSEGDPVLMKSDGFPTYHFANVVDDHFMKVSHVLRGEEWVQSTPKHLLIYKAFGWEPPQFAHLPLLVNSDGTKLSKRQGDIHIEHFRSSGYYSKAIINYITMAGGGLVGTTLFNNSGHLLSLNELSQKFDIDDIKPSSKTLEPQWLQIANQIELQNIMKFDPNELVNSLKNLVITKYGDQIPPGPVRDQILSDDYVMNVLKWSFVDMRISTLNNLIEPEFSYLWVSPTLHSFQELSLLEPLTTKTLTKCIEWFEASEDCDLNKDSVAKGLKKIIKENNLSNKAFSVIRLSLTGLKQGAPVAEMISLIGQKRTLVRLQSTFNEMKAL